jgi:dipeptidyl aminopeptidase/acylaminoacyl peptidase
MKLRHLILLAACCAGCGLRDSARSQTPTVREERVHFASGALILAGTLILPGGPPPYPAVFLFHGSGPHARDLSTARWFAEQGFAALAYDKRGVGESTGDFRAGPFMDLCADGLAAVEYLKSRKEIDRLHIGVWGLSQGGWLGPLAASRSTDISFVIAMSGPGVSPGEQMFVYYANELRDQGMPEADVREADALRRHVWGYLFTGTGYEKANRELRQAAAKQWFAAVNSQQDRLFAPLQEPYDLDKPGSAILRFRREMTYDPVPALRALRVPALFLFGAGDRLIPVEKSVSVIREVQSQTHADFTIHVFDGDDHGMFRPSGELDPRYLESIRKWLADRLGGSINGSRRH